MTRSDHTVRPPGAPRVMGASGAAARADADPGAEHGTANGRTLCGIPREQVTVYRHFFFPLRPDACPRCRSLATGAPVDAAARERIYAYAESADWGPLREALLDALLEDAEVSVWLEGPASELIHRYAPPSWIAEVRPQAEALLRVREARLCLARAGHLGRELLLFVPEDRRPFVAAGPSPVWPTD
ncbi:hypothetical protein [Yinghuangia seranimata]|uniref:hypothetical protein n=1 Tax=Yinghuangia seranimata TaxID=408067 RepID=UPI00248BDF5F|nr:hypothetical protein [Yinghuangia seranimata]MDI2131906.1 hypothetical protein [Yinghuangia seranimata]